MAPLGFIFLANRGSLTKNKLFENLRPRMRREPGCMQVQTYPSKIRPKCLQVRVNPTQFLGQSYPVEDAKLKIEFSFPRRKDYEYYVIEWIEPSRKLGLGWHQDETHPELDECHFQIDLDGETIERRSAKFLDTHPLDVLDQRLDQLRLLLPELDWSSGQPQLPQSGLPSPP